MPPLWYYKKYIQDIHFIKATKDISVSFCKTKGLQKLYQTLQDVKQIEIHIQEKIWAKTSLVEMLKKINLQIIIL